MPLDVSLARDAVARHLAQPLEMDIDEAALAAIRILTHSMVQAIEVNSVRKGYDPRDFALVAFGGAGPLFGFDIARELSIPVVIVPPAPGLTSALGLLTSNVSYDFSITLLQNLDSADLPRVAQTLLELEARAIAQLTRDGIDPANMTLLRHADCRYVGQGYELRTECPAKVDDDGFVTALKQTFHTVHQREYGRHFSEKEVELVNLRVVGVGRIPELQPKRATPGTETLEPHAHLGTRRVIFESGGKAVAHQAAIIQRDALRAGNLITGPAIVQQMDTTTVIPPGFSAEVDNVGNLIIRL
jgi:N-methylhydantoinase A/oxoprolinase/acetone carboxylase beta subunit